MIFRTLSSLYRRLIHRFQIWYHPPTVPPGLSGVRAGVSSVPRSLSFNRAYAAALLHIDYHGLEISLSPSSTGLTMKAYQSETKWGCSVNMAYDGNGANDAKRRALMEVVYRHVTASEALNG